MMYCSCLLYLSIIFCCYYTKTTKRTVAQKVCSGSEHMPRYLTYIPSHPAENKSMNMKPVNLMSKLNVRRR